MENNLPQNMTVLRCENYESYLNYIQSANIMAQMCASYSESKLELGTFQQKQKVHVNVFFVVVVKKKEKRSIVYSRNSQVGWVSCH